MPVHRQARVVNIKEICDRKDLAASVVGLDGRTMSLNRSHATTRELSQTSAVRPGFGMAIRFGALAFHHLC